MRLVVYLRVSTARQGRSGLGLEAQRIATDAFVQQRGAKVLQTFTEVESGKLDRRPELVKALHLAQVTGATLLIAKLDRLSRNAAFLLTLRDSGVRFIAADMPDANELTVGIMALVAQQEREAISKRTKEALGAAKARGQKLGNPNGAAALKRAQRGNAAAVGELKARADAHADRLRPVLRDLAENGIVSLGAVAAALNERGMLTPRGGAWHKSSVRNLLGRLNSTNSCMA
jgi:DNA invertase Pin-like site-specific DNA recombinase